MAEEVSELVVEMRPEGIEDTVDGLEETEAQFAETAGTVDQTAGDMEGFAQQWDGAMTAILGGLAVASAGLLTQVPVIGEAMAGLEAIVAGVAFQMDKVLRPVLQPITNRLFELSTAIFEADGAAGAFIGVLGTLVTVLTLVFGAAITVGGAMGGVSGAFGAAKTVGVTLIGAVKSLIVWFGQLVAGSTTLAVTLGALIGVFAVGILEATGLLDAIQGVGAAARGPAVDGALTLATVLTGGLFAAFATIGAAIVGFVRGTLEGGLGEGFRRAADNAGQAFNTIASIVTSTLGGLADTAISLGSDLVQGFINGIQSRLSQLQDVANELASTLRDRLPSSPAETGPLSDLDRTGPALVEEFARGIQANTGQLAQAGNEVASAADPGGSGGGSPAFAAGGRREISVRLDGRRVDEGTRRFSDEPTAERGRFG